MRSAMGPFTSTYSYLQINLLVLFWAPMFKWGLSAGNLKDMKDIPAKNISGSI